MKVSRIILDFSRMGGPALEHKSITIAASIKDNAYFPNPSPGLDELNAAIQVYSLALIAAQNRDRVKISEKNDAKRTLMALLVNLANHVTAVAAGNRTMLLTTGYTISSEGASGPAMNSVENFKVVQGKNSGELVLSARAIRGNVSYLFYFGFADGDTLVWDHVVSQKAKVVLSGLQAGKAYTCYLKIYGSKDRFIQSANITKTVY